MTKITIIGLGLVGNSIGMALKGAAASGQNIQVAGFDPDRAREDAAMRKHGSVDEIAPDLQQAVRGAQLVVLSTPAEAVGEVLEAIGPLADEGTTITDTLPYKGQVMARAGELLGSRVNFVAGHPFSRTVDLETPPDDAQPSADLFRNAPYCIMPLPSTSDAGFNSVIAFVELLGARPLFIDPMEHDSFAAAVSQLPIITGAALVRLTAASPSWSDMSNLAQGHFKNATASLSADPAALADAIRSNRQSLLVWIDQYQHALWQMRDLVAADDSGPLLEALGAARNAHEDWVLQNKGIDRAEIQRRAEMREAISDSTPMRGIMGGYLSNLLFKKKEKDDKEGKR